MNIFLLLSQSMPHYFTEYSFSLPTRLLCELRGILGLMFSLLTDGCAAIAFRCVIHKSNISYYASLWLLNLTTLLSSSAILVMRTSKALLLSWRNFIGN